MLPGLFSCPIKRSIFVKDQTTFNLINLIVENLIVEKLSSFCDAIGNYLRIDNVERIKSRATNK